MEKINRGPVKNEIVSAVLCRIDGEHADADRLVDAYWDGGKWIGLIEGCEVEIENSIWVVRCWKPAKSNAKDK